MQNIKVYDLIKYHKIRWLQALFKQDNFYFTSKNTIMKNFGFTCTLILVFLMTNLAFSQEMPQISSGTLERFENFASKYVDARNIDIWLPDGYDSKKKYNVIYMHDGQMLFDSASTWNHQEWKVDEVFSKLLKDKKIERCIVVGIWNNGKYRHSEYFPQKFLNTVSEDFKNEFVSKYLQNKPQSDNYLKFLVEELKPYIDKKFSTNPEKDCTFIMGSSMGGMISMYAISEYPNVFGGAACLSIAWISQGEQNFELPLAGFNYLQKNAPSAFGHKIYMDHGTIEMDSMYSVHQEFIDLIMKGKGFHEGNYKSIVYKGTGHNEIDWSKRLSIPIEFLMGKPKDQKVCSGKIDKYENFQSEFVTERNVEVWLPEGYSNKKKYAVLYMHDGQMLFDSTTTWNKQTWNVDDVASKLLKEGKLKDFIVVGVWNGGAIRYTGYFPQKPFESLTNEQKDFVTKQIQTVGRTTGVFQPKSDDYLKFLVTELKPFIDKKYSTKTDRSNTFIAGSSMGGLISMYAICEYPDVFGGAACLSTHWPGIFTMEENPIPDAFANYLKMNLPNPKNHKIYFDCGDQTLDALYPPFQQKIDMVMKEKGYTDKTWITKYFPGDDHSEKSWSKRLHFPIEFLLKK